MAITFPITLPTNRNPVEITLGQRKVVGFAEAPSSLSSQTYEWDGEMWLLDITFQVMERAVGAPWAAALRSLRGPVGSFIYGDPMAATPLGSVSGSPVVSSTTAAKARTLPVSGGSGTLLKGSMISTGSGLTRRMYEVQADVNLAGGSIEIWPALRAQATSGTSIVYTNPSSLFRLSPGTRIDVVTDKMGYLHIAPVHAQEVL